MLARMLGAAEALRDAYGSHLLPSEQENHERDLAALRAHLGDAVFAAARAARWAMILDQALSYAMEGAAPPTGGS